MVLIVDSLLWHCLYLVYLCRSCAGYTPNASYILASSLNSTHRLIPLDYNQPQTASDSSISDQQEQERGDGIADVASTAGSMTESSRPVVQYTGHLNEKYSISSRIWSTAQGNYLLSGSEDGLVSALLCSRRPSRWSHVLLLRGYRQAYLWDLDSTAVVGITPANQGKTCLQLHCWTSSVMVIVDTKWTIHFHVLCNRCVCILHNLTSTSCLCGGVSARSETGAVLAVAYNTAEGLQDQVATAGTDGSVMLWRCTPAAAGSSVGQR